MLDGLRLWTMLLIDRCWPAMAARIPEPDLLMDSPDQSEAYRSAGLADGAMDFVHWFHAIAASAVIRPGDRVLDLACGTANQLARTARLNPDAQFIGLDASPSMLAGARSTLAAERLANVELLQGDICRLDAFGRARVDVAICTMSFHHLRDSDALRSCLAEIARVTRPDGGIYLADFGRLRRSATQRYLADDRRERQTARFTEDFRNSLAAAFAPGELRQLLADFPVRLDHFATPVSPFLMVWRSARGGMPADTPAQHLREACRTLTPRARRDLRDLARCFLLSGLRLPTDVFDRP